MPFRFSSDLPALSHLLTAAVTMKYSIGTKLLVSFSELSINHLIVSWKSGNKTLIYCDKQCWIAIRLWLLFSIHLWSDSFKTEAKKTKSPVLLLIFSRYMYVKFQALFEYSIINISLVFAVVFVFCNSFIWFSYLAAHKTNFNYKRFFKSKHLSYCSSFACWYFNCSLLGLVVLHTRQALPIGCLFEVLWFETVTSLINAGTQNRKSILFVLIRIRPWSHWQTLSNTISSPQWDNVSIFDQFCISWKLVIIICSSIVQ